MIDQIVDELKRAMRKFPTWPTDPLHALAILGEEYGELNKAMLELTYEPHKTSMEYVQMEAIQTAAMAIRLAMSLDRYAYKQSEQHSQHLPSPEAHRPEGSGGLSCWAVTNNETGHMEKYRKKHQQPVEPWTPEYDMEGVSISQADRDKGSPKEGDMIAVNPQNGHDRWLVSADFFAANYEPALAADHTDPRPEGTTDAN